MSTRSIFIYLLLQLSWRICISQVIVEGKISDEQNLPLYGGAVTLLKPGSQAIITYAIADQNGHYRLNAGVESDSLRLEVSFLGYASIDTLVLNHSQILNFSLKSSSLALKEVVLEAETIRQDGDTLSYEVSAFQDGDDRVIADVLQKLPGIDVLNDGQILYQGEPIEKYYIEGLDLLEGRYGLANKNLPASAVRSVQVLENHQPVKLLDSLSTDNKTSLNIKLKNNISLTGAAELGVGFSPALRDVNLTPMLFARKLQSIVSYQTNNIGKDASLQLKQLSIDQISERQGFREITDQWTGLRLLPSPPFAQTRWLDNDLHMVSGSVLKRYKDSWDVKLQLNMVSDRQSFRGATQTFVFAPNDTISFAERISNVYRSNLFNTKLSTVKNTENAFVEIITEASHESVTADGEVMTDDTNIQQQSSNPSLAINNRIKVLKPISNQLFTFRSMTNFSQMPHSLDVSPGQFENLFSNGDVYNNLIQSVNINDFYQGNSLSAIQQSGKLIFEPEAGLRLRRQDLESDITIKNDNGDSTTDFPFTNRLTFLQNQFYANIRATLKNEKTELSFTPQLTFRSFEREDATAERSQSLDGLYFEPNVIFRHQLNAFWQLRYRGKINNRFSTIDELFYGFIVSNYRNIRRYESPLAEMRIVSNSLGLTYRNPLSSTFLNASYLNRYTSSNLIITNNVTEEGYSTVNGIAIDNIIRYNSLNLNVSKFLDLIQGTIAVGGNLFTSSRPQFINNIRSIVTNHTYGVNGKVSATLSPTVNMTYRSSYSWLKANVEDNSLNSFTNFSHSLNMGFSLKDNQQVALVSELYGNSLSDADRISFFQNIIYMKSFKKAGLDLELQVNNLFGTEVYTNALNTDFLYTSSSFILRPRQFLMSLKFNIQELAP